jgi:hypothetical protein
MVHERLRNHRVTEFMFFLLFIVISTLCSVGLFPSNSRAAESINIGTELQYVHSEIETTNNDTGNVTAGDFNSFDQNYIINVSRELYPFLTLSGGSSFELNKSRSASDELITKRKEKSIRPYIDLDFRNPLYTASVSYGKDQRRNEIEDLFVRKDFQESRDLSFIYRPAGLPLIRIFYNEAHAYDEPLTSDTVTKQTTVKTTYSLKTHPLSYTYVRGELEDKLTDLKSVNESHEGTAGYSRDFLNDRLTMGTHYRVRYNITKAPETGRGTESSISPVEGLFSEDNTPQDGPALTALTTLIDGDLTASSGINIGWTDSGNADRNIGLDFGLPVSVDRIRVFVDRNVPATASSTFSWDIYTSDDNTNSSVWTLHATVFPAPFTVFRNRFEISFPEVTARFIKVVVTPLSSTFIGTNPDLENIFVTEIDAAVTVTATRDRKITESSHNISFSLAGRLSDKTRVGYDFLYHVRETDTKPSAGLSSWTNSIYVSHIFSRVFTSSARISRDEHKTTSDKKTTSKRVSYDYSANLKAAYLETLSQTLTVGHSRNKDNDETEYNSSIFLRTNAALYKGWDAFVDIGYSWEEPPNAGRTNTTLVTAQTSVVPNRKLSFDATYSKVISEIKEEETKNIRQSYDVRASYFPYNNLSFSFQISVEEQSQRERQVLQRYTAGWSPFRGGALQIFLSYSETQRPTDNQQERSMGPLVKWDISRYASLDINYVYSTVETVLETTDLSTTTTKLTMTF